MSDFEDKTLALVMREIDSKKPEEESREFFIGKTVALKDLNPEITYKEWIWENFLAKRHITLLVAYWKAGKSTMLRALFAAMQKEEEFAGEPTKRCNVLVVTEEPEEDWVEKREEFGLDGNGNIFILSRPFKGKPNLKQWPDIIKRLLQECEDNKIDLVIFDTISTFFPINREKDSDEWLNALIPLYEFTRINIGVLLVHHFRKGAGDEMQAFRGSGVLGSFPSNLIEFVRDPEGFHFRRIIKTNGRFGQANPRTLIELQPDMTYKTLGDPVVVSKKHRKEKVLAVLGEAKELSAREVLNIYTAQLKQVEGSSITLKSIQNYLRELIEEDSIIITRENDIDGKKVPFYAQKEGFSQQKEMQFLYSNGTPLSRVNVPEKEITRENGLASDTIGKEEGLSQVIVPNRAYKGLSQVKPEIEANTRENGGTSVMRNDFDDGWDPNI